MEEERGWSNERVNRFNGGRDNCLIVTTKNKEE